MRFVEGLIVACEMVRCYFLRFISGFRSVVSFRVCWFCGEYFLSKCRIRWFQSVRRSFGIVMGFWDGLIQNSLDVVCKSLC